VEKLGCSWTVEWRFFCVKLTMHLDEDIAGPVARGLKLYSGDIGIGAPELESSVSGLLDDDGPSVGPGPDVLDVSRKRGRVEAGEAIGGIKRGRPIFGVAKTPSRESAPDSDSTGQSRVRFSHVEVPTRRLKLKGPSAPSIVAAVPRPTPSKPKGSKGKEKASVAASVGAADEGTEALRSEVADLRRTNRLRDEEIARLMRHQTTTDAARREAQGIAFAAFQNEQQDREEEIRDEYRVELENLAAQAASRERSLGKRIAELERLLAEKDRVSTGGSAEQAARVDELSGRVAESQEQQVVQFKELSGRVMGLEQQLTENAHGAGVVQQQVQGLQTRLEGM
jgi:hypothetical protein